MSVGSVLGNVGRDLATGAKRVGEASVPILQRTAEVESGEAPQIDAEQRQQQTQLDDAALNAQADNLEAQLAMGRKYGTLTPEQQQQYIDRITGLFSHPKHMNTLMTRLQRAIHPQGATYQANAPLANATPQGGTAGADQKLALGNLLKTPEGAAIESYMTAHPGTSYDDAFAAVYRQQHPLKPTVPKPAKLDVTGGILTGGTDDSGKGWSVSDILAGNAGPLLKEQAEEYQKGEAKKLAEKQKQEDATNDRYLKTQLAIADRLGRSEQFQVQMADFRSQEAEYRKMDAQARNDQATASFYTSEASNPGNKSALDTALVTDYTGILAKGGRKTQAEIAFAQKIGGLGMHIDRMWQQAQNGELPPQMRQMYINYMTARAQSERAAADAIKPSLPQVGVGNTGAKRVGNILKTGAKSANPANAGGGFNFNAFPTN